MEMGWFTRSDRFLIRESLQILMISYYVAELL
jgi:hypothetical protein